MKKLVLMMVLVLGVSAIANDCCDIKNNAKCDCRTEKKSENCHYDKEKRLIAIVKFKIHKITQNLKQKKL